MSSSTTVRIRLRCHVLGWSAAGTGRLELTWCGLLWVGASVRRRASTRTASERTRGSVGIAGETRQAQAAKLRLAPGATHGPRPAPEPGASADGPAGGSGPRRRLPPPRACGVGGRGPGRAATLRPVGPRNPREPGPTVSRRPATTARSMDLRAGRRFPLPGRAEAEQGLDAGHRRAPAVPAEDELSRHTWSWLAPTSRWVPRSQARTFEITRWACGTTPSVPAPPKLSWVRVRPAPASVYLRAACAVRSSGHRWS